MPRPPDTLRCDQFEQIRDCGAAKIVDGVDLTRTGVLVCINDHYFAFPPNNLDGPKTLADSIYEAILEVEKGPHGTAVSPATADAAGGKPVRTAEANSERKR
jgi:hypothetical protein